MLIGDCCRPFYYLKNEQNRVYPCKSMDYDSVLNLCPVELKREHIGILAIFDILSWEEPCKEKIDPEIIEYYKFPTPMKCWSDDTNRDFSNLEKALITGIQSEDMEERKLLIYYILGLLFRNLNTREEFVQYDIPPGVLWLHIPQMKTLIKLLIGKSEYKRLWIGWIDILPKTVAANMEWLQGGAKKNFDCKNGVWICPPEYEIVRLGAFYVLVNKTDL